MPSGRPTRCRLTPQASTDLETIWVYTREQWSERQADTYIDDLAYCFDRLVAMLFAVSDSGLQIFYRNDRQRFRTCPVPRLRSSFSTMVPKQFEMAPMTDESRLYGDIHKSVGQHLSTRHSAGEYAREEGELAVHSNSVESYFSIFKRGMRGTYQHCAEKHLHRYLAEFDFRHNRRVALGVNDQARANHILTGIVGKRLTYETTQAR